MNRMERKRAKLTQEIQQLAKNVKNQEDLDALLLRYEHLALRTALFHVLLPHLAFPNPQLPMTIKHSNQDMAGGCL